MKKKQKIIIAAAIAIIIIIIATVLLVIGGKKGNIRFFQKNDEEVITKMIENDQLKIEVNNTSYLENYLVIEYDITSKKGKDYLDNYTETESGLDFYLERIIKVNGKKVENNSKNMQFAERISDTQAKVYDFIQLEEKDIKDDTKIEIEVYDQGISDEESIEDDILDSEDIVEDIPEENEEEIEDTEENDENYEEIEGEEIEGTDEEYETDISEEIVDEELDEEFEDTESEDVEEFEELEEAGDEVYDTEESTITGKKIGKITINTTKEELKKDVNISETLKENYSYDDLSITNSKVITTSFGKFVIIDTEIKNVTDEDIFSEEINVIDIKLNIQDENGNNLTVGKAGVEEIILEDGRNWAESDVEKFSNATLKLRTIFGITNKNSETTKIKIIPYFTNYYEPTEDELNAMQWNKVEDGKYEATNQDGAKVEVTKIEEKDGYLNFHYKETGIISETDSIILLRNVEKGGYQTYDYKRIENPGEKVLGFMLDPEGLDEEFAYLDDINNLEFAIFEGAKVITAGDGIEINL